MLKLGGGNSNSLFPLGEDEFILTSVFFKGVGSTTNQLYPYTLDIPNPPVIPGE